MINNTHSLVSLFFSSLLWPSANAGYDEEFMMGTLMAYSTYCEEMSNNGLDAFSVYVLEHTGSVSNMNDSLAYKTSHSLFSAGIGSDEFRPTACNQIKKALKRKGFYWLFEK